MFESSQRMAALGLLIPALLFVVANSGFGEEMVTNSVGMELVPVEPGSFRMGSADGKYLQWGEGAGTSEADADVTGVAYDLTGANQPASRERKPIPHSFVEAS